MKTTKKKMPISTKRQKKQTAVLYTRVASQHKADHKSLLNQEKKLREYCKKENIEVVKVYHDVGSGLNFQRPEFRKFLKELKAGIVRADYFLVTTIDRFCRRLDEINKMSRQLKDLGITLRTTENFHVSYFVCLEVKQKK